MRKLRTAAAVILVSTGGLAAAGGVSAQPSQAPPSPDTIAPPTASLPSQDRAAVAACEGKTFNPHNSKHFPGDVSVSSRTTCPGYAVTVTVYLYKKVNGSWKFLDSGNNAGHGRTQANAHGNCGRKGTTHQFLGIGYHTAVRHSPATTRNVQRVTCR